MAAERQSSQQTVRAWPQRTEMGQTAAWVLSLPELEMPDMLFVNQYYDPIDGRASVFVLEKVCRVGTGAEDEEIVPSKNSYRLKEFKPDELAQLPLPLVKKGGMSDCATVKSARRLLECRSNLTTQTNFVNRNFDQVVVSTAPPSRKASAVLPGGDGGEGVGGCDKASSGGGCNTPKSGNPANPFTSDTSENVYEPFIGEQAEPPFQDHSWSYDPHAPPNEEWGLVEEEHSVYSSEQQDAPRDVPPPSPVDQAPASVQAALYRAASAGCLPPPTILSNKRGTSEVTPAGTSAAKRACFKEPHTPGAGETTTLSPVGSGTSAGVLPVPGGGMSKGSGVLGKGFLSKQGGLLGKGGALHGTGPPAAVSTIAHQTLSGGAGPPAVSGGTTVPKPASGGDHFNLFPNQPVQTMSADYANSVAISVQRGSPGPIHHQVPPQHPGGHQPVAPAHQPATHPAPVLNSTVGGPCQLCITNFTCDAETILKEVQFHPSSVKKHQVSWYHGVQQCIVDFYDPQIASDNLTRVQADPTLRHRLSVDWYQPEWKKVAYSPWEKCRQLRVFGLPTEMHRGGFQSICQKYGPVYLPRTVKDQRFDNGYVLFLRMEDAAKFKAAINGSGPLKLGRTPETAQDYYLRAEWAYPEGSGNGAGGAGMIQQF